MAVLERTVELDTTTHSKAGAPEAFAELERGVRAALETYSNVHRGTGHHSVVSTALFERAREIVLDYLGLSEDEYVVVFGTPWRAETLQAQLKPSSYHVLSSHEIGLPLGLRALAVRREALPRGVPFQTGGDAVELVARYYVVWADDPHRFEAGTPGIVHVVTLAKALRVMQQMGTQCFAEQDGSAAGAAAAARASEILHKDELLGISGRELLAALRKTLVGRGLRVPTAEGQRPYINLDNAASTPTFAPIWDAVRHTWRQPEAVQREIVRQVREIVAAFLGAPPAEYEVTFTYNTTEALNVVAQNLAQNLGSRSEEDAEPVVLNTWLEHHSNDLPWRYVPGVSLVRLPVDGEGFVDLGELEHLLDTYNRQGSHGKKRVRLVAISGASNVLGSFNDLPAISRIVHQYGARLLVDGAQLVAHRKVEMARHEIDYLAFSGHKVYAPFGSGALVARRGLLRLDPTTLNGIRSSGEENVAGIAALGKALALLQRVGMDVIEEEERVLTRRALRGLAQVPGVQVYGIRDPDSPNFQAKGGVIVFESATTPRNLVAKELGEQAGIGVRDGCFCAHAIVRDLIKIHPIRTFIGAVGLRLAPEFFRLILPGVVRVSLGLENDERDIEALIQALSDISRTPRSWPNRVIAATHNGTWMLGHTTVQDQMEDYSAARAAKVYGFAQGDL
jgi:selenocysteine lyase/cysteine desulfurase